MYLREELRQRVCIFRKVIELCWCVKFPENESSKALWIKQWFPLQSGTQYFVIKSFRCARQ